MILLGLMGWLIDGLRVTLFGVAAVVLVAAVLDWAVRTRRIPPFSGLARWVRGAVTPLFAPMTRRVVSAGGLPQSGAWWTLGAVVVGGIVVVTLLEYLRTQLAVALALGSQGAGGLLRLALSLTFGFLNIALLWRVGSTWVNASPWSKWVRWSYAATEWFLAPLRSVLPPMGMIDFSPLIAYFLLNLVRGFFLG